MLNKPAKLKTDKEGYLKNLSDWSDDVALLLAQHAGISLNDEHWQLIYLVQRFYERFEVTTAANTRYLYGATRFAGNPRTPGGTRNGTRYASSTGGESYSA